MVASHAAPGRHKEDNTLKFKRGFGACNQLDLQLQELVSVVFNGMSRTATTGQTVT